jgi:hypothetical protein
MDHSKANRGESSATNVSAGNDTQAEGKKKAKKESCYRCGGSGHLFFECTAILCEYCEQVGHDPEDCHLLSAPKPQLILHGISDEKLMFFECPITKSYRPKLESTRLGLLSVTGGELTIPAITAQLRRLVPVENFAWDCRQVGHNVFKVTFPDKDEIERLARFGTFHVPGSTIKLNFEQCVSSMEPTSKLPEIWILMSGIPQRRIGDFLAMWSLGTLFGKTLRVDMKYTREKGVLRILVGCLDFRRIPAKERIFIADGFYDITFEVQAQSDLEMASAATPGDDPSDGNDHGNNEDNNSESQKNLDDMDTDASRSLQEQEESKNSAANGPDVNRLAGEFSSGVKFSPKVKLMMEQSRVELSAFIKSLSAPAAAAEPSQDTAAMPVPVVALDGPRAATGSEEVLPAAAELPQDFAATPAPVVTLEGPRASTGNEVVFPAAAATSVGEVVSPALSATVLPEALTSVPSAHPSGVNPAAYSPKVSSSFRTSTDVTREILRRSETTSSPLLASAEATQLSPISGGAGSGSLGISTSSPLEGEKQASLGKSTSRIAATSPPPSTPIPNQRRHDEVVAFGGISEKTTSSIRSSQRVRMQHNGDATQLERATLLAEKRLYHSPPGTNPKPKLSFSKLSDFEIAGRATTLGISLGSNESEISNSISLLKHTEEDRRITYLQNNLNEIVVEENECSILDTANQLCSDMELEDRGTPLGESLDPALSMPIKLLKKRNKKNISSLGVSVRRSTRIINSKKGLK